MKNYIKIALLFIASGASAQVAIGKGSVTNSSVSVEFGAGNKGIILPYVLDATQLSGAVEGTVVFDAKMGRIRYLNDATNVSGTGWHDLSVDVQNFKYGADGLIASTVGQVDNAIQKNRTDIPTARTVIGSNTADTAPGIVVLSDTNKAMILPKMDSPHLNIVNPAPGMMAYDTKTNQLAVFNGTVWTFWRP